MPTKITFAVGPRGNSAVELKAALDDARARGDAAAGRELKRLLFDFLQEQLGRLSPEALEAHLATLLIWRDEGHPVFKTFGEPLVAYTALDVEGEICVVALGFHYRYAGTEEDWWQNVIAPRLRHYL